MEYSHCEVDDQSTDDLHEPFENIVAEPSIKNRYELRR